MIYIFILLLQTGNLLAENLVIPLGESIQIPFRSKKIWIERRGIITVTASGQTLSISGNELGSTLMSIKNTVYNLNVVKPQDAQTLREFNYILKNYIGLSADIQDSKLIITGQLFNFEDWLRLSKTVHAKSEYEFRAKVHSHAQVQADTFFRELFKRNKISPLSISLNANPELRISKNDNSEKTYRRLLRPFGIPVVVDPNAIKIDPIINVHITVAEIDRGFLQNYGLKTLWPLKADLLALSKSKELGAELNLLESKGIGRLLASPNIICKSGKEAEFLVGGEIPIKTSSQLSSEVSWKKYGIFLKVKPKADLNGRISLSLITEVSAIDSSLTIDGVPGITTNKVSSHFDLIETQTVALSGLLKEFTGDSTNSVPFLNKVPILGSLFSSKDFKNKKTELVIFVRPEIELYEGQKTNFIKPYHLSESLHE